MAPSGIDGRRYWAIAVPVLLVSVFVNIANARDGFSSPLWALVSALGTLVALGALYFALDRPAGGKPRRTYTIAPDGLVRTRGGKVALIRWEDITEIYSSSVERSGRRTLEFRIVTGRGERILIDAGIENHLRTGEQVLRTASRHYLERARRIMAEGGKVRFGKLWMTQHELGYGRRSARWRTLRAAHFEPHYGQGLAGGFVFRAEETLTRNFCIVRAEEIPYLAVFVELVHSVPVSVENVAKLAGIRAVF